METIQLIHLCQRDFGYLRFAEMPKTNDRLELGKSNTLVYTDKADLDDFKIIMLTLIRAGFQIRNVYKSVKRPDVNLIQIVRTDINGNPDGKSIVTLDEIIVANSISDVSRKH